MALSGCSGPGGVKTKKIDISVLPVLRIECVTQRLTNARLPLAARCQTPSMQNSPLPLAMRRTFSLRVCAWGGIMPPGGRIWMTVRCDDNHALLRVRDTGVGVPPAMREKMAGMMGGMGEFTVTPGTGTRKIAGYDAHP